MKDDRYDKLGKEDKKLFDEVRECELFFRQRTLITPNEDQSKHFIILAHNYNSLGYVDKAKELLKAVSGDYLENGLLRDLHKAVTARNDAERLLKRGKKDEAEEMTKEAEFFLVYIYLANFMHNEFSGWDAYDKFLEKAKKGAICIETNARFKGVTIGEVMKFCIIKDSESGYFYGKKYEEGYNYSTYTQQDAYIETCWKPLSFFIGIDDDSCGLIIFESRKKALDYIKKEWNSKIVEVINIGDVKS